LRATPGRAERLNAQSASVWTSGLWPRIVLSLTLKGMHKKFRLNFVSSRRACLLAVLAGSVASCAVSQPAPDARRVPEGKSEFVSNESTNVGSDVRADFDDAMKYLREEDYEKGIVLLTKVTARSQSNTAPYINLAIAYRETGNLPLAEENLKKALALNPEHPVANNEYGMVYRKTGRFPEAKAAYEKTLEKHAMFLPARKNLAILCDLYMKDLKCAVKHYQLYSTAVPDDKTVRIWITDLEKRLGQ
jgi:Tfp pilus assembly protein PilF